MATVPGLARDHRTSGAKAHGKLGFGMCVALIVGNMVGSGVFLLPASLAPLGWNAVLGWLLSIGGTLCLAIVFARLARDMAGGCGAFTYANAAFGPAFGFVIVWSYWISVWTANATLAVAAISNLSIVFPGLASTPGLPALAAIIPLWLFTWINCMGVRRAGGTQSITTILKLIPLIGAIGVAAGLIVSGKADPAASAMQTVSPGGVGAAATLTLFALIGFESALIAADRIEDAERTVPRATLYGTAATGMVYLLSCSAVTMLLPTSAVAQSNAPYALFFANFVHPALGPLIAILVAIAALGALNGFVLLQGELLLTVARKGLFPAWFAVQNRHTTPQRAHIFSSALASLVVLSNYTRGLADLFTFMVLVSTSAALIFYLSGTLASVKLVRENRIRGSRGFHAIAVTGLAYAVWTFYGAGLEASIWSLAMTATGIPVYFFMTRRRPIREPARTERVSN